MRFERGLEVCRTDVKTATQFYFAYLAVHAFASNASRSRHLLNRALLFWTTAILDPADSFLSKFRSTGDEVFSLTGVCKGRYITVNPPEY